MGTPLLPLALVFTSAQSVTSTLHHHLTPLNFYLYSTCLAVERAERVSARAAPSVTARSFATTSRASPSLPSAVSLAVVVSSVSRASSTRRPAVSSRSSSRTSSATRSPTRSTPSARRSRRSTSSTPSSAPARPSTVSASDHLSSRGGGGVRLSPLLFLHFVARPPAVGPAHTLAH